MLVVGLIDIQHMQSVNKRFFFFFFSSKIATILVIWKHSDRETPSYFMSLIFSLFFIRKFHTELSQ